MVMGSVMFKQFVCAPPEFRLAIHNGDAVLLLSQMLKKQHEQGEDFTFSQNEIKEQTGLVFDAQRTSRALLISLGILLEWRKGLPCVMHYTVDLSVLSELLKPYVSDSDLQSIQCYCAGVTNNG